MPFEFADVVLVPFPFTDQTASKQRPARRFRALLTDAQSRVPTFLVFTPRDGRVRVISLCNAKPKETEHYERHRPR